MCVFPMWMKIYLPDTLWSIHSNHGIFQIRSKHGPNGTHRTIITWPSILEYQGVNSAKSPFSYGFPMIFPWLFLWLSHFPMSFPVAFPVSLEMATWTHQAGAPGNSSGSPSAPHRWPSVRGRPSAKRHFSQGGHGKSPFLDRENLHLWMIFPARNLHSWMIFQTHYVYGYFFNSYVSHYQRV